MTDHPPLPDLTWPALLARWTLFAQSSVALPRTPLGDRWRAAVPSIIALQAVTFALAEVPTLPEAERPLAHDRAAILINRHAADLARLWPTDPPQPITQLLADARLALSAVASTLPPPAGPAPHDPHIIPPIRLPDPPPIPDKDHSP